MRWISALPVCALFAVFGLAAPAAADTKAGVDAWSRGDFTAAVQSWEAEAARGDADALYNLGQAYRLGKGATLNLRTAEDYYGRAAVLGHIQGADNFGILLFQRGEQTRALPYVSAAADRGDPRAQYLLGVALFNGTLMAKDWPRAYALVSLAQQQGIAPAAGALKQMDLHVPIEQRQAGVQLAAKLDQQAQARRAQVLMADDLGRTVPIGVPARPAVAVAAAPAPAAPASPATAGADYARPSSSPRPAAAAAPAPAKIKSAPLAATAPAAKPAAPAAPARGPWRVQLGAFAVAGNADALWNRVKARPELAGYPRIDIKSGAVTRLQAGGFASQGAARAACAALAPTGTSCLPVLR